MAKSHDGNTKNTKEEPSGVDAESASSQDDAECESADAAGAGSGDPGQLSTCPTGSLYTASGLTCSVGALEAALLREFPREDAESWDRTGLLVGDRSSLVSKVALALDPTVIAICEASASGANVLVTHHPAYLEAPDYFAPEMSVATAAGAGVWAAVQNQVALINFHTALDVSPLAANVLPSMLGFNFTGCFIEPRESSSNKGYGQICQVGTKDSEGETLAHIAARCTSVFGRAPRVWGNFDSKITTVVTATGSAGSLGSAVLFAGMDCLICGEIKYHDALALSQAGLCIIELGHDVSELPLVAVLASALERAGITQESIVLVDQSGNWRYPEAIRV